MYLAIFWSASATGPPCCAEIVINNSGGDRWTVANTTVHNQTTNTQNWGSGRVHDGDLATYYYEDIVANPLILSRTADWAETFQVHRGMTSFANYAPDGFRVYQSDVNHGTSEGSWPTSTKRLDVTLPRISASEWTAVYNIYPPILKNLGKNAILSGGIATGRQGRGQYTT